MAGEAYSGSMAKFNDLYRDRIFEIRVIGSIRREGLDHAIVFSEESLRRTLHSYFSYYHDRGFIFRRDSPKSRPVQSIGAG